MEEQKEQKIEKKENTSKFPKTCLILLLIGLGLFLIVSAVSVFFVFRYSEDINTYLSGMFSSDKNVTIQDEKKEIVVTQEESTVIDIVKNSKEAVVSIAVSKLALSKDQGLIDQSSNIGTGFIIDPSGIIVTNQHVVSDITQEYKVVTSDNKEYDVEEILRDDLNDIAIIKINGKDLNYLKMGDSEGLLVGQNVIAIGTPLGEYAGSVTTGIISGLNRSVTASGDWFGSTSKTYEDVIQTDAAINPGNSGGPLINSQSEVIGINFATTSGADNISFAIPINKVKTRVEEYRTYGKFIKPFLGVSYQMITAQEALYYTDVVPGALVVRVDPASPAYNAGIKRGDIIIEFGGEEVSSSLSEYIQTHKVGEEVVVKISRNGETQNITVKLSESDS